MSKTATFLYKRFGTHKQIHNLRPQKLYSTDDELRQGVFPHCRRKKNKNKNWLGSCCREKKSLYTNTCQRKKKEKQGEKKKLETLDFFPVGHNLSMSEELVIRRI